MSNSESEDNTLIEFSNRNRMIYGNLLPIIFLLIFVNVFLPLFYYFLYHMHKNDITSLVILLILITDTIVGSSLFYKIKECIPFLKVKVEFTPRQFNISLLNVEYFGIKWNEIREIKITNIGLGRLKIQFIDSFYQTKSIRLDALTTSRPRKKQILDNLGTYCELNNINITSQKRSYKSADSEEYQNDLEKIAVIRHGTEK